MKSATVIRHENWENADFPVICESCLGDNPYLRMMKLEFDKECKICSRPFTVFRWKPSSDSRFKKTEICQTCAKFKNICQTCLLDLEFGLPVQVRDQVLTGEGRLQIPNSDVNREWQADLAEKKVAQGLAPYQSTHGKMEMRNQLQKLARAAPYYKRNAPHVCSFFLKGQCNRGKECPYRHEIPEDPSELSKQNIKDRYYGVNDPVAMKLLTKLSATKLTPPEDKEIKTLYLSNVSDTITSEDLKDTFYPYGEITEIKRLPQNMAALITYATRSEAEKAADSLYNNLTIKGITLRLKWGKSQILDKDLDQVVTSSNPSTDDNFFSLPTPISTLPPPNPAFSKPSYRSMNPKQFGAKRDR